jgi:cytochrome oxidase assembly protein ShyY1
MVLENRLLLPIQVARLAAAFELPENEVLADASVVSEWADTPGSLRTWLNARHAEWTDEAEYFVYWVRLQVWLAQNDLFRG